MAKTEELNEFRLREISFESLEGWLTLELRIESTGSLAVRGVATDMNCPKTSLNFAFEFDQTDLSRFHKSLGGIIGVNRLGVS